MQDDDEADDTAWTQILRDLEDVGVYQQQALGYRDFIVDWLVSAVNEGRLLEQRTEPSSPLVSQQKDVASALFSSGAETEPTSHCLDVPVITPPAQRSHSAPFLSIVPMLSPLLAHHQADAQLTSTVSLPASVHSSTSLVDSPGTSETDTSSLYA